MQGGPQGGGMPQGVDGYEQMVNTFAEQAKTFWRTWGPAGEPMIQGIEAWAQMQNAYIQWLRQTFEAGGGEAAQRTNPIRSMPIPGLTFGPWPGPGGSEGGGWDR